LLALTTITWSPCRGGGEGGLVPGQAGVSVPGDRARGCRHRSRQHAGSRSLWGAGTHRFLRLFLHLARTPSLRATGQDTGRPAFGKQPSHDVRARLPRRSPRTRTLEGVTGSQPPRGEAVRGQLAGGAMGRASPSASRPALPGPPDQGASDGADHLAAGALAGSRSAAAAVGRRPRPTRDDRRTGVGGSPRGLGAGRTTRSVLADEDRRPASGLQVSGASMPRRAGKDGRPRSTVAVAAPTPSGVEVRLGHLRCAHARGPASRRCATGPVQPSAGVEERPGPRARRCPSAGR
jgi:hypothetical protein